MDASLLDQLHTFIIRAKQATYVGSGRKLLPYRLGSHDLQFIEGDWAYHDSYLGENDFIGEEAVYHKQKVVWAMNYFGRILAPRQDHLRRSRGDDQVQPHPHVRRGTLPGRVRAFRG